MVNYKRFNDDDNIITFCGWNKQTCLCLRLKKNIMIRIKNMGKLLYVDRLLIWENFFLGQTCYHIKCVKGTKFLNRPHFTRNYRLTNMETLHKTLYWAVKVLIKYSYQPRVDKFQSEWVFTFFFFFRLEFTNIL